MITDTFPQQIWIPTFLSALSTTGNISAAARKAGVNRSTIQRLRNRNPEFDLDCELAIDFALDGLEEAAFDRAKKESDNLLMFLLRAHRPEIYGESKKLEVTGKEGGPIAVKAYVGFDPSLWDDVEPNRKYTVIDGKAVPIEDKDDR